MPPGNENPNFAARALKRALAARGLQIESAPPALIRRADLGLRLTFEHIIALRMMESADPFVFVQIGAFDGQTDDPVRPFVDRYGWHGLLVEPQERCFSALCESYAGYEGLSFKRVAVSERRETRRLYKIADGAPGLPEWASQLATFDLSTLLSHRDQIPNIDALVRTEDVECVPLTELLAESGLEQIDLFFVDAEGYDAHVVQMLDFTRFRPAIIRFEHRHLEPAEHNQVLHFLMDAGYKVALEPFDTVAVFARDD